MKDEYIQMRDRETIFVQYHMDPNLKMTLVYVHGGPGQGCWDFKYAAEKLSETCNVIMYDQRGVLRSNTVTEDFSSELLIRDIEDIRKHFQIDKLILCGHSYGGHLILRYALEYPTNVERLIYICPTFDFTASLQNVYAISYRLLKASKQFETLKALKESVKNHTVKSYLAHLADIPEEIREVVYYGNPIPQRVKEIIFHNSTTEEDWKKGIEQQKRIFDEDEIYKNYLPYIRHLHIPSLLIVGDHDPICSDVQQKTFLENSNNTLAVIKNAGHSLYSENADEFVEVLKDYLRGVTK